MHLTGPSRQVGRDVAGEVPVKGCMHREEPKRDQCSDAGEDAEEMDKSLVIG